MHQNVSRRDLRCFERLAKARRPVWLYRDLLVVIGGGRAEQLQGAHPGGGGAPHRHHDAAGVRRVRPAEPLAHVPVLGSVPGLMSIIRESPRYSTLLGVSSFRSFLITSPMRLACATIVASDSSFSSSSTIPDSRSDACESSAASGLLISCCNASDVSPMPAR